MSEEESLSGNGVSFSIDISTHERDEGESEEKESEIKENGNEKKKIKSEILEKKREINENTKEPRNIKDHDPEDVSEPVEKRIEGAGSGATETMDSESRGTDVSDMNLAEKGSLVTGWFMLTIAIALFILSMSIFLFGLETVFSNKKFPDDTDTPCYLSFLVMGMIFLILGIVYRDMAVHPEFFENENMEKSTYLTKKEEWEKIKKRVKEQDRESKVLLDGDNDNIS